MNPVGEAAVPPNHRARQAFIEAIQSWDEAAADAAVAGFTSAACANEFFVGTVHAAC